MIQLSLLLMSSMLLAQSATPAAQKYEAPKHDPAMKANEPAKEKPAGYFDSTAVDFKRLVGPPPAIGSKQEEVDIAAFRLWQQKEDTPRWALAKADADAIPSRFADAMESNISEKTTPILFRLLVRANFDMDAVIRPAKDFYGRLRPYQRFQLEHVCGMAAAPTPDTNVKKGNSYPSGHGGYGWLTSFLLAEVAPERAQAILMRGKEFTESRMVCGAHFPTDLAASQVLAAAVVEKLHANTQFQHDMACGQEEHAVMVHRKEKLSVDCEKMRDELTKPN